MKKMFASLTILFILAGCATHDAVRPTSLLHTPSAHENKVIESDIELFFSPYRTKEENEQFFGVDLVKHEVLPAQMALINNTDATLQFTNQKILLIDPDGEEYQPLTLDEVMERAKKSFWRTAGWGVAFGLIGAIPSAMNVSKANKKIRADYDARIMKDAKLVHGATTEGTLFFSLSKDARSLDGFILSVALENPDEDGAIVIEYNLNGDIPERKPEVIETAEESFDSM
ncbi:MAG: hypothetical protein V3W31_09420 [Thermodesulfobacteriota bacterium]